MKVKMILRRGILKTIRAAGNEDMESVFMMGYDAWGDKLAVQDYLNVCNESSKYKNGVWYVLVDTETNKLLSSLIVYTLKPSKGLVIKGIGSISTPPELRGKGYASILIKETIKELEEKEHCNLIFLYSDIDHIFYNKLNFKAIPTSKQKYKNSVCMYYSSTLEIETISYEVPAYF
ncbi:GNAT family N-acetyltransferase [Peribacillus frigoritolerans]|nr:GNAT family N-acetyltransferase [Peribacillus frigoritolerans]